MMKKTMRKKNSQCSLSLAERAKVRNNWTTRKKRRIYDLCVVVESVAWIWRFLGIFPITVTAPFGIKRYALNKLFAAHSVLIFGSCIGNFTYVMLNFDYYFRGDALRITSVTMLLRASSNQLCMFISNVCRIYRHRELSASMNHLLRQNAFLGSINCRLNWHSSIRIIQTYVGTSLGIVMFLLAYDTFIQLRNYNRLTIEFFLWSIGLFVQMIDVSLFVTLVGLLGFQFRALNEKIQSVATRANSSSPKAIVTAEFCAENLRALGKSHYNMCALGKRINRFFDWDIIVNVVTAFIILSTTLYYIFYEIQREAETSLIRIFSYIHWEIYHSIPVIFIVIVCNWTSQQALYAGKFLHEIRVRRTDSELYDAIKSFSLQMHHQKLEFTARGLFPINSTLLQAMMGNITTYLVILIQFRPKLD